MHGEFGERVQKVWREGGEREFRKFGEGEREFRKFGEKS